MHNPWLGSMLNENRQGDASAKQGGMTGLVLQGGGMRGSYSIGALVALSELGLDGAFDHVYGVSSGAINGAYFVAGQARLAARGYVEDLASRRFISFTRVGSFLDIDFLIDSVVKNRKPLDVTKLREAATTMHVGLTDYSTGGGLTVTSKDKGVDFAEALRATAALPFLYGKTVRLDGKEYLDGSTAEPVPLFRAVQQGCNRILLVLTSPLRDQPKPIPWFLNVMVHGLLCRYPKVIRNGVLNMDAPLNDIQPLLETREGLPEGVSLSVIAPSDSGRLVSHLTRDRERLMDCIELGRQDTYRLFGCTPPATGESFA
jgi:predicted patatin/cPLA2 family phospholipase